MSPWMRYRGPTDKDSFISIASPSVACRGCWMPGANEVLGCRRKYFVFLSQNFLPPFLVVHLNLSLFSHQLSNFTRIRSLDAPTSAVSCSGNDIFTSFLVIYLHF